MAILEGVKSDVANRWETVEIESDAASVINHIRGIDKLCSIETIIQYCLHLACRIRSITWRYIPRTANLCADWVVKQALAKIYVIANGLLNPPPPLSILLSKDYDMYLRPVSFC